MPKFQNINSMGDLEIYKVQRGLEIQAEGTEILEVEVMEVMEVMEVNIDFKGDGKPLLLEGMAK